MMIKYTSQLTVQEKEGVAALRQACQKTDGISPDPMTEAEENWDPFLPCFALACQGESLVGFASAFMPEKDICEITAMVLPSHRGQGIFTGMMKRMNPKNALLMVPGGSKSGQAVARHLGLSVSHSERMMGIPAEDLSEKERENSRLKIRKRGENWYAYLPERINAVGKCHLVPWGDDQLYLYGLWIDPEYRNLGYGREFVLTMGERVQKGGIKDLSLKERKSRQILLQVSSENEPACHLYESLGFCTVEEQYYYRWKPSR